MAPPVTCCSNSGSEQPGSDLPSRAPVTPRTSSSASRTRTSSLSPNPLGCSQLGPRCLAGLPSSLRVLRHFQFYRIPTASASTGATPRPTRWRALYGHCGHSHFQACRGDCPAVQRGPQGRPTTLCRLEREGQLRLCARDPHQCPGYCNRCNHFTKEEMCARVSQSLCSSVTWDRCHQHLSGLCRVPVCLRGTCRPPSPSGKGIPGRSPKRRS